MRFGSLDFIVTTEGELVRPTITIQPLHFTGINAIAEALEELQLHAPEDHASESDQLFSFNYERLERQLETKKKP